MNYRHAYHAGNFADVLKHAVLTLVLKYMTQKPQPLRVIDVHAGIGRYDLEGIEAGKTREWEDGIGRLMTAPLSAEAATLLKPYLEAVAALNADGVLRHYPGSPLLARMLLRRSDALVANELHPDDAELLKAQFLGAPNTRVLNLDAWIVLKSLLPPPERRGLILIDPPFEEQDEFDRLARGLGEAIRRFATGTYLVWYPVKDPKEVSRFLTRMRGLDLPKLMNVSLAVCGRSERAGLSETGLLLINPPFVLRPQLETILPELSNCMAAGTGAAFALEDWSK